MLREVIELSWAPILANIRDAPRVGLVRRWQAALDIDHRSASLPDLAAACGAKAPAGVRSRRGRQGSNCSAIFRASSTSTPRFRRGTGQTTVEMREEYAKREENLPDPDRRLGPDYRTAEFSILFKMLGGMKMTSSEWWSRGESNP
jgi:hypothetical protein